MRFADLLRATVFLLGVIATGLGAAALLAAPAGEGSLVVVIAAVWWVIAIAIGVWIGRRSARSEAISDLLATARTSTALPSRSPARIAIGRLWPFVAFAIVCAVMTPILPTVPAFGAGFALLNALAWRNREALVTGVEDRDGVCFYVEDGSGLQPIKLIRTPGLRRDFQAHYGAEA